MAFDFAMAHMSDVMKMIDTTSAARFFPRLAQRSHDPGKMVNKLKAYADKHLPPAHVAARNRPSTPSRQHTFQHPNHAATN